MPENLLLYVLREYGMTGLLIVVGCAMVSAAWAQILFLKRWQPQTQQLLDKVGVLISQAQAQHLQCQAHYAYVQRLTEDMRSLTSELRAVAENIHAYHVESVKALLEVLRTQKG